MADYWNQHPAAGQQSNPRFIHLQKTWERLEQQLSLFCQVITFVPGVYETLDVPTRDFLKHKMEVKYDCDAFYVADGRLIGRVFLAPASAVDNEWMTMCYPNQGQLPVVIDQGTVSAPGAPSMMTNQSQHLDQMIQKSVHQAVQQAMQQSFQHLSVSSPQTSPQKLGSGSGNHDGYDGSPKKRKLELSPKVTVSPYKADLPKTPPTQTQGQGYDVAVVDTGSKYRKKTYASGGPRPPNSFMLYRKHVQKEVTVQNPGTKNSEISKIIGMQWRNLPEEEKEYWQDRQKEAAIEHSKMYPNYRYTPKHKSEKDVDKTPIKGKGKSVPKKLQIDTASQSSSQSSYELPPSPPWDKIMFGEPIQPEQSSSDQLAAPSGPSEAFFDQAMSADASAAYPTPQ
ncbi:HMG box transcriptional regulator [Apiospora marii]|uniref:HMG box transcriptional regulator n=1 Tax=Apiospora marii TaxID=335849 RepID=UPI00312EBBFD